MFLWPEGYQRQPQNPLKQLIEKTEGDILLLLEEDLFVKQAKLGDALAVDTLVKGTQGLLEVMFMDYEYVLPQHYEQLTNQYTIMWELFDLKVEKVNQQILNQWEIIFELLKNKLVAELQWFFALRIIQFVNQENPQLFVKHQDKLILLQQHLEYTYVGQIVIEMLNCNFNEYQKLFLTQGIEIFEKMNEFQVINFTQIIHEIFTKIKQQEMIDFIISSQILNKMFQIIQNPNLLPIVLKNAAHVISIITVYYSNELQNLDLEEEESEVITQKFRTSNFYNIITQNLKTIVILIQNLCKSKQKINLLSLKLVEIIDNLVRITDLSLWDIMHDNQIIEVLISLLITYPKSDIMQSQIERIFFYIFERASNDYHPFWAHLLIKNYQIHNKNIQVLDRQIFSFEKEINDKIKKELDYITFDQQILEINQILEQSSFWKKVKWSLRIQQVENEKKLGSQMQIQDVEAKLIEISNSDNYVEEIKEEEDNLLEQDNQNTDSNQVIQEKNIEEQQENDKENEKEKSESSSSSSSNESDEENQEVQGQNIHKENLSKSANLEQLKPQNKRTQLNIQFIEKARKQSIQFEKISSQMNSGGRRLSLQAGLNIKELSPTYEEFKLDLEKKVLRNINDNSILKVDELDNSISQ